MAIVPFILWSVNSYKTFVIKISEQDWDTLSSCTNPEYKSCILVDGEYDRPTHCDYVDATCNYDGRGPVPCEARRKGFGSWRPMEFKPSIKIKKMEENDDDYIFERYTCGLNTTCNAMPGGTLYGESTNVWQSSKVTLNNEIQGTGEHNAYKVFRDIGVIAPLAHQVTVELWRGPKLMVRDRYVMVETINDKAFVKKYVDEDNYALFEYENPQNQFKRSKGVYDSVYEDGDYDCGACNYESNLELCGPPGFSSIDDISLFAFNQTLLQRFYSGVLITNHGDGLCVNEFANNAYVAVFKNASNQDEFVIIPSGADQTFKCNKFDIKTYEPACSFMQECFQEDECKASFDTELKAAKEKAHKVSTQCFEWWKISLVTTSSILLAVGIGILLFGMYAASTKGYVVVRDKNWF